MGLAWLLGWLGVQSSEGKRWKQLCRDRHGGRETERQCEREGENGERREQGLGLSLPKTTSVGEVVSMHERGVERGEPREPRSVEILCAVGHCCCFC